MIATRSSPSLTGRSSQPRRPAVPAALCGFLPYLAECRRCLDVPASPRALGPERRAEILAALRAHGKVRAADLAAALGVSVDTVRRDLDELAAAGLLRRVHGGRCRRGRPRAATRPAAAATPPRRPPSPGPRRPSSATAT